jgi:hypothetical protein
MRRGGVKNRDKYTENRSFYFSIYCSKRKQTALNDKNSLKVSSFKGPCLFNSVFPIQDKPLIKMPCLSSLFAKFKLYETA